jgi:parvulin-like peptidyl-prolyl isomerase
LKAGEDFKDVAKALSKDPYASATGGDLGWFSKDQRPEYAEQVFALKKPGDLTGPLKTSRGWHVFKLVDRRAPEKKSFEEAKDTLRRRLKSQKRSTAYRDFIAELKKAATIETNEPVLNPGGEGAAQGQPPAGGQDAPAAGQPAAPAPPAAPGGGETGAGGQ